jgi:nucleoside 2-deoxyribosyltransferase
LSQQGHRWFSSVKAFLAYPAAPSAIADGMANVVEKLRQTKPTHELIPWEHLDIPGRFIQEQVVEQIERCDCILADVTAAQF